MVYSYYGGIDARIGLVVLKYDLSCTASYVICNYPYSIIPLVLVLAALKKELS
ncbi:hypothetical protein ACFOG5_02615 [Pedobacter fastidiosus]|uniref:hypothetical protein n=1 Tax=Pedobacter fastidiosus TaxID=2765361 RepID=UPI00361B82B1